MPRKHDSPLDKAKAYEVVWGQVAPIFEAARPYGNNSFVYLVGEPDGPVKIGISKDPIARLRTMQTGNPRRLRIEYVLIGDMPTEKLLHEFWEPHAISSLASRSLPGSAPGTEWFKADARAELLPIIETAVRYQLALLRRIPDEPPASFTDR